MSNPNEEKITTKQVQFKEEGRICFKNIDTIKCKECGEEFTNEWVEYGWPGETKENHSGLRAKLRDHKSKVHQIGDNLCSKCKTQLYDYSGEQFSWYTNEKHGQVCKNCLDELDKSGELWDNFFIIRIYKCVPGSADPGMESGSICDFCNTAMCNKQHHQKINGKLTLKHNCQVKCLGSGFFMSGCDKPKNDKKTFQLTQDWLDYLVKYKYSKGDLRCPDCEIETIKRDINLTSNDQEISKLKLKMKEVEKITGKSNNNQERERERERERANSNSDCWIRSHY